MPDPKPIPNDPRKPQQRQSSEGDDDVKPVPTDPRKPEDEEPENPGEEPGDDEGEEEGN